MRPLKKRWHPSTEVHPGWWRLPTPIYKYRFPNDLDVVTFRQVFEQPRTCRWKCAHCAASNESIQEYDLKYAERWGVNLKGDIVEQPKRIVVPSFVGEKCGRCGWQATQESQLLEYWFGERGDVAKMMKEEARQREELEKQKHAEELRKKQRRVHWPDEVTGGDGKNVDAGEMDFDGGKEQNTEQRQMTSADVEMRETDQNQDVTMGGTDPEGVLATANAHKNSSSSATILSVRLLARCKASSEPAFQASDPVAPHILDSVEPRRKRSSKEIGVHTTKIQDPVVHTNPARQHETRDIAMIDAKEASPKSNIEKTISSPAQNVRSYIPVPRRFPMPPDCRAAKLMAAMIKGKANPQPHVLSYERKRCREDEGAIVPAASISIGSKRRKRNF